MAEDNSGPQEGIKGVVEDAKGKVKEGIGTVAGRNDMIEEGKAQQDKAEAERDAAYRFSPPESVRSGDDPEVAQCRIGGIRRRHACIGS
jgi:uncharacterized protein YjbJ (UPF0337 family)